MNRVRLEQLTVEGLREVARQNDLEIRGDRAALFDRITDFFESCGGDAVARVSIG